MQVNTQNIKRPGLFSNFFTKELDYKNDFVSYIDTSSNSSNVVHKSSVTSNICKTAKSLTDNIEKSLKSAKNILFKRNEIRFNNFRKMDIGNRETVYDDNFKVISTANRLEDNKWEFAKSYRGREYGIFLTIKDDTLVYSEHSSRSFNIYTRNMISKLLAELLEDTK